MFSHPFIKKNLILAWPLALNALLMQSMLLIDTYLVSPLGEIPLAAMGIATTIVAFVLGIQMALANGSQLVLSRAVGSGLQEKLAQSFWAGMSINLLVGWMFWLILTFYEQGIISLLTDDTSLYFEINRYLELSKYMILFTAITQIIIALFNSLGRTRVPFKGYLIEMPLNAVLSYLLIHGSFQFEGYGVLGAAMGSLIAITVRLIYLVTVLYREKGVSLVLSNGYHKLWEHTRHHFVEIFPVAANVTALSIGATTYQLIYSQLNINAYVAITIIMPWVRVGTQFVTAWAHASAIIVSQAIGSRKFSDLAENVNISIRISMILSLITALFFLVLSLVLHKMYSDLTESTYTALAVIAPLYIFLPLVRGYNTIHGHVLRALGKTSAVFVINFTGQWIISIPLCMLLMFYFDASIFWVFAVMPFEEIIKVIPFRAQARYTLKNFAHSKFAQKTI